MSCLPHASFDEINDTVVNPERGELVRGSDPPLVYSAHGELVKGSNPPLMHSAHSTTGDMWRAPIWLLLKTH